MASRVYYPCHWDLCREYYDTREELINHLDNAHLNSYKRIKRVVLELRCAAEKSSGSMPQDSLLEQFVSTQSENTYRTEYSSGRGHDAQPNDAPVFAPSSSPIYYPTSSPMKDVRSSPSSSRGGDRGGRVTLATITKPNVSTKKARKSFAAVAHSSDGSPSPVTNPPSPSPGSYFSGALAQARSPPPSFAMQPPSPSSYSLARATTPLPKISTKTTSTVTRQLSPHKRAKIQIKSHARMGAKPYAPIVPPGSPSKSKGGIISDRSGRDTSRDPPENDVFGTRLDDSDASWEKTTQSQVKELLPYGGVSTQVENTTWNAEDD